MAKALPPRSVWQRGILVTAGLVLCAAVLVQSGNLWSSEMPAFEGQLARMPGEGMYSARIAEGATVGSLIGAARAHCADKVFCEIRAWPSQIRPALTYPLLPHEAAAMDFTYSLNRYREEAMFDCKKYPAAQPDHCLALRDVIEDL